MARQVLAEIAAGHEYYGLHRPAGWGWVFREWAPNADGDLAWSATSAAGRSPGDYQLARINANGDWEGRFPGSCAAPRRSVPPADALARRGGRPHAGLCAAGRAGRAYQDLQRPGLGPAASLTMAAREPPAAPRRAADLRSPCRHGAGGAEGRHLREFAEQILPRIAEAGYNTVQLMAVRSTPTTARSATTCPTSSPARRASARRRN